MIESHHADDAMWKQSKNGEERIPSGIRHTNIARTRSFEREQEYKETKFLHLKQKKALVGERSVCRYLSSLAGVSYVYHGEHPPHKVDFSVTDPRVGRYFIEVKATQQRREFEDYGFNHYQYQNYKELQRLAKAPVKIFFVDFTKGCTFGAWLDDLDQPHEAISKHGRHMCYPLVVTTVHGSGTKREVISFPACFLDKIYDLLPEEIAELKEYTDGDYRDKWCPNRQSPA